MITAAIVSLCLRVLAPIVLIRLAWWAVGDLLLDSVGVPFLDAGWTPESAWAMRPATTIEDGEGDTWARSSETTSRRSSRARV